MFKILLIGDSGVGKSSIILRYTDNTFNEKLINSIGVDFKMKKITFKEKVIKIQIVLISINIFHSGIQRGMNDSEVSQQVTTEE